MSAKPAWAAGFYKPAVPAIIAPVPEYPRGVPATGAWLRDSKALRRHLAERDLIEATPARPKTAKPAKGEQE